MQDWDNQKIEWYLKAEKETNFFAQLKEEVLPYIQKNSTVTDVGCGIGLLSLELAPHVQQITSIDISENAIESLRSSCQTREISNITPLCHSIYDLPPQPKADVLVMSFFGDLINDWQIYRQLANKYIIAILRRTTQDHNFTLKKVYEKGEKIKSCAYLEYVLPRLQAAGVTYTLKEIELEFGQPLTCRAEAEDFIRAYYKVDENQIPDYLEQHLVATDYGYYLGNLKKAGIVVIDLAANTQEIIKNQED